MIDRIKNLLNERLTILNWVTPINYLPRLSRRYGCEIYIKRDDLTGIGLSGNKIRKLEYHFYRAKEMKANCIITAGGIQSNHARATAVLSRQIGWKPVLLLAGKDPRENYKGNLLLDKLVDAEIVWTDEADLFTYSMPMMEEIAERFKADGYSPYIIPLGGSNTLGYRGYIRAGIEIFEQLKALDLSIDQVFCAVGTGGTLGGLVLFSRLFNWNVDIYGVNVMLDADFFRDKIHRTILDFANENSVNLIIDRDEIHIIDGYVGPGYAKASPELIELIKMVAREEGILLDNAYTGKAFQAMLAMIEQGKIQSGSKILFMHTGGLFGLFAIDLSIGA